MKTSPKVARIVATLITFGAFAGGSNVGISLSINKVGDNLEIAYTDHWDTFTKYANNFSSPTGLSNTTIYSQMSAFDLGNLSGGVTLFSGNWSTNTTLLAGIGPGSTFGFAAGFIAAENGYTQGSNISGSLTFTNMDIAGGGFTGDDVGSFVGGGNLVTFTVATVPEPSSTLLLCLGSLGLLARRKRG